MVGFPAKQHVDGHAQGFSLDVHKRDVDGAHGSGNHRAAAHAPEGLAEYGFPDLLRIQGIHADDLFCEILDHSQTGPPALTVGQAGLPPAADAFIRIHPDQNRAPGSPGGGPVVATGKLHGIDTCDFHVFYPSFLCDICFDLSRN